MQKIATKIFTYTSVIFGVTGILLVLTSPLKGADSSDLNRLLERILIVTVFVILPSFALSVAGKYLNGKSE